MSYVQQNTTCICYFIISTNFAYNISSLSYIFLYFNFSFIFAKSSLPSFLIYKFGISPNDNNEFISSNIDSFFTSASLNNKTYVFYLFIIFSNISFIVALNMFYLFSLLLFTYISYPFINADNLVSDLLPVPPYPINNKLPIFIFITLLILHIYIKAS